MPTAIFRFYGELNVFLDPPLRQRAFRHAVAATATLKHTIEALGVPHTEVALLLANGEPAPLGRRSADGDRIAVYPAFSRLDIAPLRGLPHEPSAPQARPRFVADAHLGALARLLRMSGFDTLYDNRAADDAIERVAAAGQRIVLTRDRELLKRRGVTHGVFVHALDPEQQWLEVAARHDLAHFVQPLILCLECNAPLRRVEHACVLADNALVPPAVRARHQRFSRCDICRRVFWKGSHWRRMRARIEALLCPPAGATQATRDARPLGASPLSGPVA